MSGETYFHVFSLAHLEDRGAYRNLTVRAPPGRTLPSEVWVARLLSEASLAKERRYGFGHGRTDGFAWAYATHVAKEVLPDGRHHFFTHLIVAEGPLSAGLLELALWRGHEGPAGLVEFGDAAIALSPDARIEHLVERADRISAAVEEEAPAVEPVESVPGERTVHEDPAEARPSEVPGERQPTPPPQVPREPAPGRATPPGSGRAWVITFVAALLGSMVGTGAVPWIFRTLPSPARSLDGIDASAGAPAATSTDPTDTCSPDGPAASTRSEGVEASAPAPRRPAPRGPRAPSSVR